MDNNELKNKNLEAGLENFIDSFAIDDEEVINAADNTSDDKSKQNNDDKVDAKTSKSKEENTPKNLDSVEKDSNEKVNTIKQEQEVILSTDNIIQVDDSELTPIIEANLQTDDNSVELNNKKPGEGFFDNFNEVFGDATDLYENVETTNVVGEPLFTSFEVADELGITPQTIRNYIGYFKDFLNIERDERGHNHFTAGDVETLKLILDLKRDKRFTNEKVKTYLLNNGKMPSLTEEQNKNNANNTGLSKDVMANFAEYLTKLFSKSIDGLQGEVNENFTSVKELLGSMSETISSQETLVKGQSEIINSQKEEIKRLNNVIASVKDLTKNNEGYIKSMLEEQKTSVESTREILDSTKKEVMKVIGNGANNDYSELKKEISSEFKNSASKISEKLNENKQALFNLSRTVEQLSGADKEPDIGKLKQDINNSIDKKNSSLLKDIQNDNAALLSKIESLMKQRTENNETNSLTDDLKDKFSKAERAIRTLADKNSSLEKDLKKAQSINNELSKKLAMSTEIIKRLSLKNQSLNMNNSTEINTKNEYRGNLDSENKENGIYTDNNDEIDDDEFMGLT